jgi:hypothetical protein
VQKFIRSTGFRLRVYSIQQAEPAAFHARSALWSSQEDQTRRGPWRRVPVEDGSAALSVWRNQVRLLGSQAPAHGATVDGTAQLIVQRDDSW